MSVHCGRLRNLPTTSAPTYPNASPSERPSGSPHKIEDILAWTVQRNGTIPFVAEAPPRKEKVGGEEDLPPAVEVSDTYDWDLPPPAVPVRDSPVGGRLRLFWQNWALLDDPYVTGILRDGFRLPLTERPPLTSSPFPPVYSDTQIPLLREAIDTLVSKRAVEPVLHPESSPGFYSPVFLRPKKDSGKMRMIFNMSFFNHQYMERPPRFRLISLPVLRDKISVSDWLVSIDLEDAYLHVPVFRPHWKYLRFIFEGVHYQWRALPFGICTAPWLFTRITSPITSFLHQRGIEFDPYIDDCLMSDPSLPRLRRQRDFALHFLEYLGWKINVKKSHLEPTQTLTFIGGLFQTDQDRLTIPPDRWTKIQSAVERGLTQALNLRNWQSILGLFTSAQDLTLRGRLMLRPLQLFLIPHIQAEDLRHRFRLPRHLRSYLQWWSVEENVCQGIDLTPFNPDRQLFVDASLQGWGAHLDSETLSGLWSPSQRQMHINNLEMQAVILAIQHWAPIISYSNLLIASDNSTVVWTIRNQGSTTCHTLLDQAFHLFQILDEFNIRIRARHIPGCQNVLADALSRPDKPSPTEWMLHPEAFRLLCQQFHRPLIDLFATAHNHQLPVYVSPLPDPLAWEVDALSMSWEGLDAYAFPPPVLMARVVTKIDSTSNLTLLLVAPYWPARTWFPALKRLAQPNPTPLPEWHHLLRHPHSRQLHPDPTKFALHVWVISKQL